MFRAGSKVQARSRIVGAALALVVGASFAGMAQPAGAHAGGTDQYGCHSGSEPYHCHLPDGSVYYPTDTNDSGTTNVEPPAPSTDSYDADAAAQRILDQATEPGANPVLPDTVPPVVPRIVKAVVKGAVLTIIFAGDDDSRIDIVSDVDGVLDTVTGSSAEQQVDVTLGPDEQSITLVATDGAGNTSESEPISIDGEKQPRGGSSAAGSGATAGARDGGGESGPNLLIFGAPLLAVGAVAGASAYAVRRKRRRARAAGATTPIDAGTSVEATAGRGPLDPPPDF